jgi:predicted RNase H-like HicB family nuclease
MRTNTIVNFQVIRSGIVFELQDEPEGGYTISVPSLPGCISYGKTFEEAMVMIKDAMTGWLEVAREQGFLFRNISKKLKQPLFEV